MKTLRARTLGYWNVSKSYNQVGDPISTGSAINKINYVMEYLPLDKALWRQSDQLLNQIIGKEKMQKFPPQVINLPLRTPLPALIQNEA